MSCEHLRIEKGNSYFRHRKCLDCEIAVEYDTDCDICGTVYFYQKLDSNNQIVDVASTCPLCSEMQALHPKIIEWVYKVIDKKIKSINIRDLL